MAFTDKIFGLVLVSAGLAIAVYWSIWQLLSLPIVNRKSPIYNYFMEPYYLFKIPALALIIGLLFIDWFISRTNRKIAAEKAKKAAAEAAKKKQ